MIASGGARRDSLFVPLFVLRVLQKKAVRVSQNQ
jgi:hypothetical protein